MQSNFNPFKVKTGDPAQDAHLKRQFIRGFPFPHKLWVITNARNYEFMQWNGDGTAIILDIVGLGDYLNSPRCIFHTNSRAEFLKYLDEFQFERLDTAPEEGNNLTVQYKHEDFQRHRLDLLAKVRRRTNQASGETTESVEVNAGEAAEQLLSHQKAQRMTGDPCFMKFRTLSNAEKSRMQHETTLQFEDAKRKLQNSLNQNTAGQNKQRSGVAQTLPNDNVDISSEMFVNPLESAIQWSEEFRPDYAGYYGGCSEEQLKNFFGDYLPQKQGLSANNSGMRYEQEETPQQSLFSGHLDYAPTAPTALPLLLSPIQQTSHNLNLPHYAGYYGNRSKEQVKEFFGDYHPQKQEGLSANDSGMRFEQIETPQQLLFSGDLDYTPTPPPLMMSPLQQMSTNLNLPWKLEPIFKSDVEVNTDLDYAGNEHGAPQATGGDISMVDFTELKLIDETGNDPGYVNADLPINASKEQEPDPENETFTAYLDGLNVLFECDQE